MSILIGRYAVKGPSKIPWTRVEAKFVIDAINSETAVPEILRELNQSGIGPKERTLNSLHHLIRNVLTPMESEEDFDQKFPEE